MRRRDLITALGGAVMVWPNIGHGQQRPVPVVGFLGAASREENAPYTAWFLRGLAEAGFADGQNIVIDYRWAEGRYDRLPGLAADLVRNQVAVIFASGGQTSVRAAMAMTTSIPIIFSLGGGDPVKQGLVTSVSRPDGNATGVTFAFTPLAAKRLEVLREAVPKAAVIALLLNPRTPASEEEQREAESAAPALRLQILVVRASNAGDIDAAFASLVQGRAHALLVMADPFFLQQREQLAGLAARHAVPMMSFEREATAAGGLMSYGPPLRDSYHQAGIYAGRILKGAKPADLPIISGTKVELVINLKTAKALGLTIPPSLLARADEVIE